MEQRNDGYNDLFADSTQQYQAYHDTSFLNTADPQAFNDAGWGVNAGTYPSQSRAGQQHVPSWQQNANHLSINSTHNAQNGTGSPYARSLSQSPAPFGRNVYGNYANQQNVQYRQPQYDPALLNTSGAGHHFANNQFSPYQNPLQTSNTIAPQALQQETRPPTFGASPYNGLNRAQPAYAPSDFTRQPATNPGFQAPLPAVPKGEDNGYLSTISFDQLVRATNSARLSNYLNIGKEAREWPVNRTTTLPQYVQRRSKNELRKLAGNDANLLAKIGKKAIRKDRAFALGPSGVRPVLVAKGAGSPSESITYEGESSSSEESSSDDDDDSSYTSEEDLEGSPLPNKRPETPKEAVEYDTIKALWRSKRRSIDSTSIKTGITTFAEILKTIRDRWKTDSAAVNEAEKKKRVGELPLLRSRVKDQRDMAEVAFKAALKHGHRSIVELLGQHSQLVFVCYQFLLDRFKAEDVNGALSRVMLETMSLFTNLDSDLLERTNLNKVLARYAKVGDAKTQYYAKRITSNAEAASKEKPVPSAAKAITAVKSPTGPASPPTKRAEPQPVAGIKRAASTASEGAASKKVATGPATKVNGSTATTKLNTAAARKPGTAGDMSKTSTSAAPTTKTKQVSAKPSSFFSSLTSAAKKPGTSIKSGTPAQANGARPVEKKTPTPTSTSAAPTSTFSFAETMAKISQSKEAKPSVAPQKDAPKETAEEKAKRLRKDERRKLHVQFKMGEDLVQIRYFSHDPDEELGHDDSQMRDVADAGGEGRALKQQGDLMDVDEEEEAEEEPHLIEFKEPKLIDFSDVDPEEREKCYSKYAGGRNEPESLERAKREQYEANTLIVFYADEKDIPPNPREPNDPYNGEHLGETQKFGRPDQKLIDQAAQRIASNPRYSRHPPPPTAPPTFDLAALMRNQQQAPPPPMPQHAPAVPNFDLEAILANLRQSAPPQQQQQQAPPMINFNPSAYPPPQPAQQQQQQQQAPDISAILAAINPQPSNHAAIPLGADRKRWGGDNSNGKNKNFRVKTCRYWLEGRCVKGDQCTYLHERNGEE